MSIIKFPKKGKEQEVPEEATYTLPYPIEGSSVFGCLCGAYHFYHTAIGVFCAKCNAWQDIESV